MRRFGWFTMTGSAAAAVVIGAVVLLHPSATPAVHARAILDDLKNAVHRGLRIECRDLVADDAELDATITILFTESVNLAQLVECPEEQIPEPEAVYMDARVALAETNEDAPGLKLVVQAAFSKADSWLYARFDHIPDKLIEEAPPLVFFTKMLRGGVLLDLNNLPEDESGWEKMFGSFGAEFEAHAGDDEEEDADESSDESGEDWDSYRFEFAADGRMNLDQKDGEVSSFEDSALQLLNGRAGRDQLQELVSALEQEAEHAEVKEVEPGLHVLRAEGFYSDEEILQNATLEIGYREGAGVEWLRMENLGTKNGVIRVEFIDDVPAEDRLTRERYLNDGTQILDLGKLAESFAGMFGNGGDSANSNDDGESSDGNENSNGG